MWDVVSRYVGSDHRSFWFNLANISMPAIHISDSGIQVREFWFFACLYVTFGLQFNFEVKCSIAIIPHAMIGSWSRWRTCTFLPWSPIRPFALLLFSASQSVCAIWPESSHDQNSAALKWACACEAVFQGLCSSSCSIKILKEFFNSIYHERGRIDLVSATKEKIYISVVFWSVSTGL